MNLPVITEKDSYKTRSDYHALLEAQAPIQLEKLRENEHKPRITTIDLYDAIERMDDERKELQAELEKNDDNLESYIDRLEAIIKEIGDILNFAGAGIIAANKEIQKTLEAINDTI